MRQLDSCTIHSVLVVVSKSSAVGTISGIIMLIAPAGIFRQLFV